MTTEQYDIKTNIKIGQQIFENLPNDIRPGWAGLVLSRFDNYIKDIPTSIKELYPIIDNKAVGKKHIDNSVKSDAFYLTTKTITQKHIYFWQNW